MRPLPSTVRLTRDATDSFPSCPPGKAKLKRPVVRGADAARLLATELAAEPEIGGWD